MSFAFNEAHEAHFNYLLPRYPQKKSLVLPSLWMVQYQEGYISMEAMHYLCEKLEVSMSHLYGVATFYTMFNLEKLPPYHVQVCKTLSCALCGKDDILHAIEEETGLKVNEANEHFKISQVECMGACGGAPMLSLNEDYYENLTAESVKSLLRGLVK